MKTLEELIFYCNEIEPVGALLLTGEWGCGKTYLIENELKNAMKDTTVILRISLFGLSSIEEIHTMVKRTWMNEYYKEKGVSALTEKAKKLKTLVSGLEGMPELVKGIVSSDWTSLMEIKEKIGEKQVVLVFDDLERCRLDSIDVLGAINDYCENMKFHTIIVANQDKIKTEQQDKKINALVRMDKSSNKQSKIKSAEDIKVEIVLPAEEIPGSISYLEIKEKIIQRTVKYIPDFDAIIHTVVVSMKYENQEYEKFVYRCEKGLLELFAPDRTNQNNNGDLNESERPHNIRSLKCAISDFYRVYNILVEYQINDIEKWLYSFVSYIISYKADIAKEGAYGTLFSDEEVKRFYPAFQNQYIFNSVKKWILHGIWDEEEIKYEIEIIKKQERAKTPSEILRTHRIMDVNEDVVNEGFEEVLKYAYEGSLTLDEYVQFIINSCWARMYNFDFPVIIDWKLVQQGVKTYIEQLTKELPEGQQLHSFIGNDNRENFTAEEWETYQLIEEFKNGDIIMFSKNRKLFIEGMEQDCLSAFTIVQNKRFNVFDDEMAYVTAKAFERVDNAGKSMFSSYFKEMWQSNINSEDLDIEKAHKGFENLLCEVIVQKEKLSATNKSFAICHTDKFIDVINELINDTKDGNE